jgi:hypothetical protein
MTEQWKPTAGWQAGRLLKTVTPLLFVGWFFLVVSGKATDLIAGGTGQGPHRFLLIFAGFAAITLVSAVFGVVSARRRRAGFASLAAQRGWRYQDVDTGHLPHRWDWSPFGVGSGRRASSVLLGHEGGYPFAAFQYRWVTGGGDDRTKHTIGVVALRLPAGLPRLEVHPEGLIGSVAPGLVRTDIDVESEAFNRRYRVDCDDRRYAVDVLTPRTVEALLTVRPFRWRIDGADLIALAPATDSPPEVLARLSALVAIASGIPSYVWKDRGRKQ